ncbi:hypothetical protein BFW38_10225 [Terasakiispira papahanaumokuakeensis]|uniref:Uncharacterized protein n=1 Tax=Terasakiispira papahanaumokuakeensis TaxID=197479 RepID=A0A1E2VA61_9GAMM|nr:hypothetical protein [Terasakiispira papahanaumokuakeensis]ODC03864.1 hypothetical protein BFW38_10225 [Terasakiispira papahanaumokuakeensis]
MSIPMFIAVDAAEMDESSYPVAIAWSMPDGRIKSVLIMPEDHWQDDVAVLASREDMDLELHGVQADEVIRELLYDQLDDVFYTDQLFPQEQWLLKLFDAARREVTFELAEAQQLMPDVDWLDQFRLTLSQLGLDEQRAEDRIRAMLEVHVALTGDEPEWDEDEGHQEGLI